MKKNKIILCVKVFLPLFFFVLALESAYRFILYVKFPDKFHFSKDNENSTMIISDKSLWKYDARFGYSYSPVNITTTIIQNRRVSQCLQDTPVNIQGNIGPLVSNFNQAKNRIIIFGDSFTAHTLDGETWPDLFSKILSKAGYDVKVMNLARDGYGLMQMFDFASVEISEFKPTLVIFAFNSTAIQRARSWRVEMGSGENVRLLSTIENSSVPHFKNSVDMGTLMPAANSAWCHAMLAKSAEEQQKDKILKAAINKTLFLEKENKTLLKANVWDLKSSYIYYLLVHGDPFYGQWHYQISPAADPIMKYNDLHKDPVFLKALSVVQLQGVPFVLIHLPLGISIRDHQEFFLDSQGNSLKDSLEHITKQKVISMRPYLSIKDDDGMKLCMSPDNCHPSQFGMQVYAESIAKIILPFLNTKKGN